MTHVRKVMNRVCHAPSLRRQHLASNCWQGARETLALLYLMGLPYVTYLASAPSSAGVTTVCWVTALFSGGEGEVREYMVEWNRVVGV